MALNPKYKELLSIIKNAVKSEQLGIMKAKSKKTGKDIIVLVVSKKDKNKKPVYMYPFAVVMSSQEIIDKIEIPNNLEVVNDAPVPKTFLTT